MDLGKSAGRHSGFRLGLNSCLAWRGRAQVNMITSLYHGTYKIEASDPDEIACSPVTLELDDAIVKVAKFMPVQCSG